MKDKHEVTEDIPGDVQEALDLLDTAMDDLEASRLSEMKGSVREVEGLWRHSSPAWYTPCA